MPTPKEEDVTCGRTPLCCVVWLDAHGKTAGEYTVEELKRDFHKPALIKTYGLLLIDDAEGVTLAQEITGTLENDGADTYRGIGFVPRGMIRAVIPMEGKSKPARKRTPSRKKAPSPIEVKEEVATLENEHAESHDAPGAAGGAAGTPDSGENPDPAAHNQQC